MHRLNNSSIFLMYMYFSEEKVDEIHNGRNKSRKFYRNINFARVCWERIPSWQMLPISCVWRVAVRQCWCEFLLKVFHRKCIGIEVHRCDWVLWDAPRVDDFLRAPNSECFLAGQCPSFPWDLVSSHDLFLYL